MKQGQVIGSPVYSTASIACPRIVCETLSGEVLDVNKVAIVEGGEVDCTRGVIKGRLITGAQPYITSLGVQREDFNMGGNSITNAGSIEAETVEAGSVEANTVSGTTITGTLSSGVQAGITGLGTQTQDLDMGGNNIVTGGLKQVYAHIQDQKPQNTSGGDFTSGAWRTRTLNTTVSSYDPQSEISLASNQITLEPGTWRIIGSAPTYATNHNQTRVQRISNDTTEIVGECNYTNNTNGVLNRSAFSGDIVVVTTDVFEIQHRCDTTRNGNGFGEDDDFTTEVFTDVWIFKIAD